LQQPLYSLIFFGFAHEIFFVCFPFTFLRLNDLLLSPYLYSNISTCIFFLFFCFVNVGDRKLEFPIVWDAEHDIVRYKKDCKVDDQVDHDHLDFSCALENTKVSESFLLMKFYSLSSGVAHHLLTATDGTEIEIPFELTDEEEAIIRFPLTSFILGRSGTGKTTVLTMKLYQIEQHSFIASQGIELEVDLSVVDPKDRLAMDTRKGESFVKQVLITVSPKLCSAIKNHICRLKR
jgi:hypothetical protein